jgi:hypothetical protein
MGILKMDDDHDVNRHLRRGNMNYLKVDELKPFYTYKIRARNGRVGIWRPKTGDFLLRRTKFYDTYTFGEIHWDLDKNFGTARPLEELEASPFKEEDLHSRVLTWEEGGLERPEWADTDTYFGNPREKDILNYLKRWEDKMDMPHPKES